MSSIRRTASGVGNDKGSKEKGTGVGSGGRGVKRTSSGGSVAQSTLSFHTKKAAPASPAKKKLKTSSTTSKPTITTTTAADTSADEDTTLTSPSAIDLTHSSPPPKAKAKAKSAAKPLAPMFTKPKRTSSESKIDTGVDSEDVKPNESGVGMESEDVELIRAGIKPLGAGKETKEMIENLELVNNGYGYNSEFDTTDDEANLSASGSGSDDEHPQLITPKGDKIRKSMIKANEEVREIGEKKRGGKKLDAKDRRWNGVYEEAKEQMGNVEPIHCTPKTHNRVHHILRVFDLSSEYGPCVGLSRLERWNRAKEWGLEPPEEVREILITEEGAKDSQYRETVFHERGIYVPS